MMKKIFIIIIISLLLLSGCSDYSKMQENMQLYESEEKSVDSNNDLNYRILSADWQIYGSIEDLVNAGDVVVLGEVTELSFEILDITTAEPPTEDSNADNCYLYTIYELDVLASYKGCSTDKIKMRVIGGQEGIKLDEQISILGEGVKYGIPLLENAPSINIGETYLFVLYQYGDTIPTIINVDQSVYETKRPLTKERYSNASFKDIISFFGEEKWADYKLINHIETE